MVDRKTPSPAFCREEEPSLADTSEVVGLHDTSEAQFVVLLNFEKDGKEKAIQRPARSQLQ